ncbi:MAG: hypothetical protein SGPRY_009577 [Prymnesium sp.]
MVRVIAWLLGCLVGSAGGVQLSAGGRSEVDRRSVVVSTLAAFAPGLLAVQAASAADQVCFGKCPEDTARKAERLAIQQGTSSMKPPTLAELITQSVEQREAKLGMSLSDEEKKQVESKVRAAFPGVK